MEPVRNDTTTDRRTAVELAKRLLVDSIWRTAKIEVDGVSTTRTASQSAWPAPATSCASVCSGTIVC